ncbi:hypothetical protein TNCV_5015081 [Trichonephila clavipes]|nr:hypothetical protein TNCV_5015081 [Trichonephila clavipes]
MVCVNGMDVCKCIMLLRHGVTINSRPASSPLVGKCEAAAATVNISRLLRKNRLVRQSQMRDRDKAFLRGRGINIQLFALRRRDHGDFEKKPLTLDEKLKKRVSDPNPRNLSWQGASFAIWLGSTSILRGRGSLVLKIMDLWPASHDFELRVAEDPPCGGDTR